MEIRPYQTEAVEAILDYAIEHPTGRLLVVCPPGGGKTLIIATILRIMVVENGLRGMIVAHRREIIEHHYRHLLASGLPSAMVSVIMGSDSRANLTSPIQIVSIDTINHRQGVRPPAQLLVSDEAHRDASRVRRRLRKLYPQAFQLGVTGTPTRLDGKGLRDDFDDMLVVSSNSELIVDGYLTAPKVFTVPVDRLPNTTGVKTKAGDFDPEGLERVVNQRVLVGEIVSHWKRSANGLRTVVFASSIAHSKHIVASFQKAGVPAEHLDQDVSVSKRKQVLDDLEAGILLVVSCVNILAEGWDCPPCKCVVLARPTKSLTLHLQQMGRCMRPWEEVTPVILDHAGNVMVHGLPQMDREWSLDTTRPAPSGCPPLKVCPYCMAVVYAGVHHCPECNGSFGYQPSILQETTEQLVMFQLNESDRKAELDRIVQFAERKGFSETWVERVLQAKYGT